MKQRISFLLVASAFAAQVACSSSDAPSTPSAAGAAGVAAVAGSAGASAGAPSAGAGGAAAGATGTAGAAGASAGAAGSAGGSSAGSGGAAPFGAITCTPTGDGDGKHDLTNGEGAANPPEWTLGAGVTAGTVTQKATFVSMSYLTDKFQAKALTFPYWIYTSANYVKGKPAIVLLMGDGNQFLNDFHFPTVLDNLTAKGDLPPTVAIFIDPPTDGQRVLTYDPPTDTYTKFLFDEFLPKIVYPTYTVSKDPNAWAIVGYSASGGQGWKVLWNRPDDIHKFVGFNSSFGATQTDLYNLRMDWVVTVNAAPPRPSLRATLLTSTKDIGTPKDQGGDGDPRGNWQSINTNMAAAVAAKGGTSRLMIGKGMHYPPVDGEHDLPSALRWTFQGCKF